MGGTKKRGGKSLEEALTSVIAASYKKTSAIVFGGDNYSEEWHAEAEKRGLVEPAHDPGRPARADLRRRPSRCSATTACSTSGSCTRATT